MVWSHNGLSPERCQTIIWISAGILLIGHLGTNSCEIVIEIYIFSFKKMHLKTSSTNFWPFCLGLNVFTLSEKHRSSWWRHQMETFSALLAISARNSPVTGEFPAQRPVTRSFDVFLDLRLNKRLSKQSWGWWFETLSRPLWRHRNVQ